MTEHPPIPLIYRITFHWVEPIFALLGGLSLSALPELVLLGQTPNAAHSYSDALRPLTLQAAGGWCLLSFMDAFLLRHTNDRKVWRLMMMGGFISDTWYISSIWLDLGNAIFFSPTRWNIETGWTIVSTIVPMILKATFIMGIGTGENSKAPAKRE